ncbi:MAG: riboflavin biosynthesis protein RibF [Clostridia bacterium]|nr:riboflavin biosynthesis protein RibF [Clostridia bacterium]
MKIIDLKHPEREFELGECGLCLGNFDGVHIGHRALIRELKRLNSERAVPLPLGAFCFEFPPSAYLCERAVPQIVTNEEKLELFRQAGLNFVIFADFAKLKDLDPDDFVREVLLRDCHCRMAVCGFNYTYGARGAGTAERLAETFGTQPSCTLSVVPNVVDRGMTVSSSAIRKLLLAGHPEDAARLLGRPFFIRGSVSDGKHIGRAMGFPTANISFPQGGLVPAHGVYLTTVRIARRTYYAITNVGTRPTFDDGEAVNCESFLFDFNGDLYGKRLEISFLRFLRAERAFASREELEAQIARDIARAKEYI